MRAPKRSGPTARRIAKNDPEGVFRIATHRIARTRDLTQHPAERGERLITGQVPGLFVDLRHLVDVDHEKATGS